MFEAAIKVSSKEELKSIIKNHPIFFAILPNSIASNSKNFLTNFELFAKKFTNFPFIILDESIRDSFGPNSDPKAPVSFYIFRDGYMLFRRDHGIWFEDVDRALQFASVINMQSWLLEEPRFKLELD